MSTVKSPGLVLQRIPFGDTSLILKIYTAHQGLLTLLAKGARASKSKLRALTDFFLEVQWIYPAHFRGEMGVLHDAALITDMPGLREMPLKQTLAQVWLECYLRYSPGTAESQERYDWLMQHLQSLDRSASVFEANLLSVDFLLGFCSLSGFAPQFQECAHCGCDLQDDSHLFDKFKVPFDMRNGGLLCSNCSKQSDSLLHLTWDAIRLMEKAMDWGLDAMPGAAAPAIAAEKFLWTYLQNHAGDGRALRSLEIYREMFKGS